MGDKLDLYMGGIGELKSCIGGTTKLILCIGGLVSSSYACNYGLVSSNSYVRDW